MSGIKALGGVDFQSARGTNMADPSAGTDAATKQYVDAKVAGLSWKDEARAATTTNGTLASAYANGQVIDGVTLVTGDRILLKDQTTQTENGIYTVNASGAPTRATDADATAELNNATIYVTSGTTNAGRQYTQTTANPNIGSSNIVFAQITTSGTTYTADGQGIELSGNQFALELDTASGLSKSASGLKVDASVVARKFSADCAATTNPQTFTHNLGTKDVHGQVRVASTDELVEASIIAASTNTVTVDFGGAPTAAQYRVTVFG
jgi:hypothetical protein